MEKLFDEKLLLELNQKIKKMNTTKARIFQPDQRNLTPHCGLLTSLARILSAEEVCGCIHWSTQNKEKLHWNRESLISAPVLSTNKEAKNGQFRELIASKIIKTIEGFENDSFRDVDKLDFYKSIFSVLKKKVSKHQEEIAFLLDQEEIRFIYKMLVQKKDWESTELLEIEKLRTTLWEVLSENSDSKISWMLTEAYIYIEDVHKICSELCKPENRNLMNSMGEDSESWTKRYQSKNNLHCEMAELTRDFENTSFEKSLEIISSDVKEKNFTVSKFCCFLCHLGFISLAQTHNEKRAVGEKSVDFCFLGNSCTVFPNWQNPEFKKSPFISDAKEKISISLKKIIKKIEDSDYILLDNQENFIENVEVPFKS